jgi:hypothetical protein
LDGKVPDKRQLDALNLLLTTAFAYEIDNRFQTVDELVARLEEVRRPQPKPVAEDLDAVLARESAALRQRDRKTQLYHFRDLSAPVLNKEMQGVWQELWQRVSATRLFNLSVHEHFIPADEKTPEGDLIVRNVLRLFVQNHPPIEIRHTVVSVGLECVVYRTITEGSHLGPPKTIDGPTTIVRYQGGEAPDCSFLRGEMTEATARAVSILSNRIQGGQTAQP